MSISEISTWLGAITGFATLALWVWKLIRWVDSKRAYLRDSSAAIKEVAEVLASNATNPARRADIYFYLNIQYIKIRTRQQAANVLYIGFGILMVMLEAQRARWDAAGELQASSVLHSVEWGMIMGLAATAAADYLLRGLEGSWMEGVEAAIRKKASEHSGFQLPNT